MENVTVVIRIDAGLVNVNPETVEEALNKYFYPDGAVSVFYAAQQGVQLTGLSPTFQLRCVHGYVACGDCGTAQSPRN